MLAALRRNRIEVAELLMSKRVETDVVDKEGRTPLHWASTSIKTMSLIPAILDAGADKTAKDGKAKTAYDLAERNGLPEDILATLLPE